MAQYFLVSIYFPRLRALGACLKRCHVQNSSISLCKFICCFLAAPVLWFPSRKSCSEEFWSSEEEWLLVLEMKEVTGKIETYNFNKSREVKCQIHFLTYIQLALLCCDQYKILKYLRHHTWWTVWPVHSYHSTCLNLELPQNPLILFRSFKYRNKTLYRQDSEDLLLPDFFTQVLQTSSYEHTKWEFLATQDKIQKFHI